MSTIHLRSGCRPETTFAGATLPAGGRPGRAHIFFSDASEIRPGAGFLRASAGAAGRGPAPAAANPPGGHVMRRIFIPAAALAALFLTGCTAEYQAQQAKTK